jgi:cell division protein FtsN
MLRFIVLVLLLANGVYFAWSHDYLRMYGFAPVRHNEPQRLAQQIRPESIQLLSTGDLKKAEAQVQADQSPKECLQAGPFDEEQLPPLRKALDSALPSGSWQIDAVTSPARWIVYMGKYANSELQTKKRAELAGLGISSEAVDKPDLQPGLVLAGFDTEAAAKTELAKLAPKGIRTAKVVQEREAGTSHQLKLPSVSDALKVKLQDVKPAMAGHAFKSCS